MDLQFISGEFLENVIPKEKQYIYKYFKTDIQRAFANYWHVFRDGKFFVDHTGHYCCDKLVAKLCVKMVKLENIHKQAKTEMDLDLLQLIEKGRYKL